MGGLPPVFIEFLGKSTGFMATSKGVRSELKTVEREGGGNMAKFGAVSKAALMGVGVAAAVAAVKAVHMAADFQTQMTRVQTGAGELKSNMGMVSQGVLTMAGQVGQSTEQLTTGLYMVESAGYHGQNGLNVLRTAAMGAKVGAADLGTVTDALTTAMNAYGLKTNDVAKTQQNATDVMNALIGTEAEGKTNMEALAGSMASILPVASAAHVGLNEVLGAMATMTAQGTSADVAATYLRQTIGQLSNPSAKAAATMKGLGLDANQVSLSLGKNGLAATLNELTSAIQSKMGPSGLVLINTLKKASGNATDFQGALNKLSGSQKTYIGALSTMVGGTKSMMGALQLTGPHMKDFQANVAGIAEHVKKGGKNIEGWAEVQGTFNQKMAEMKGSLQAVAISIGNVLLPYATKFIGWLSSGVTWLTAHKQAVYVLAGAIGGVLVVGLAAAAVAAWSFTAALLANPVTWIVAGVLALVAGLVLLAMHWKQAFSWVQTNMPGVISFFKSAWSGAMKFFSALWDSTMKIVHSVVVWFDNNVLKWVLARVADFTKFWSQNSGEISQLWSVVWAEVKTTASVIWDWLGVALNILGSVFTVAWDLIVGSVKMAWTIISGIVTFGVHLVLNIVQLALDLLTGHWGKVWGDLIHLVSQAFADIWHFLSGVASSLWGTLVQVGTDIIHGIVSGLEAAGGAIMDTLKGMASNALKSVKSLLGINSPSRVFRDEVGKWIPHGIAEGIHKHAHVVHEALRRVHHKVHKGSGSGVLTKMQNLGIYAVLKLVQGLTGSKKQLENAVNHVRTVLMQLHARGLDRYVAREGAALLRLADQRDAVAARLKAANANLATLQKDWAKEQANVANGIMQSASVVMQPGANGTLSAGDVISNMYDNMEKATQFADNLKRLKQEGLSSALIQQIASAGVDQGGATAQALAHASQDQLKQLNTMQSQLGTAANSAGAAVADSMYGAGIDSAKGLIKGLQSQEAAIQKQMLRIAEQMKNAIKQALGIHSPSRIFHEIGTFITAGLANGVTETADKASGAVRGLGDSVVRAGKSTPTLKGGAASGATVVYYTVNVEVQGTVRSDRDLRDLLQQEMLRLGSRNPTTWTPYRR